MGKLKAAWQATEIAINRFLCGFELLESWPKGVDELTGTAQSNFCDPVACHNAAQLRALATIPSLTPDLRSLLQLRLPIQKERPVPPRRRAIPRQPFNQEYELQRRDKKLFTCSEAADYLYIGRKMVTWAARVGLMPPTFQGVRGRIYRKCDLKTLRRRLHDRIPTSSVRSKYGITSLACQQLVAAGYFDGLEDTRASLYPSAPFVLRGQVYKLIAEIHKRCASAVPAKDLVSVRDVFMAIGGRDKPWVPLLQKIANGEIPVYPALDPSIDLADIRIPRTFAALVSALRFDFADFPAYERSQMLRGPEWAEYLNIGKAAKREVALNGYLPVDVRTRQHLCALAPVQQFGQTYVSLWEIRALIDRSWLPPQQLRAALIRQNLPPTLGTWFWHRSDIETAIEEYRFDNIPRSPQTRPVNFLKLVLRRTDDT